MTTPKPMLERAAHARELLNQEIDAWVASATADGDGYLIPLSYVWSGNAMIFATADHSRTLRDLRRTGKTRVSLPDARDVVILDGRIEIMDVEADAAEVEAFVARHVWDPRQEPTPYTFFRLVPDRIQAWNVASELPTRVVMRDGRWLDELEALV